MPEIYLDNAAAMRPSGRIPERFAELLRKYYVNGEAGSLAAFRGRQALEEADSKMLDLLLGKDHGGIAFYTNSGTEAVNMTAPLLREEFLKKGKGKILTTKAEHPVLGMTLQRLAKETGCTLEFLPLTGDGGIQWEALEKVLQEKEKIHLAAIHHVQSESGRIQDLPTLRKCLDKKDPSILLLADTIQSAGKIPLPWQEARLDFAFLSGQKTGCPTGGVLLARKKWEKKVNALRQIHHLAGRCPLPGAILLAETFTIFAEKLEANQAFLQKLQLDLRKLFAEKLPELTPTLPLEKTSPWIAHFLTSPYEGAILTRMLGEKAITLSAGSACSSETNAPSPCLLAMGIKEKNAFGSLRLSFSGEEKWEKMVYLAGSLRECLEKY